MPLFRLCKNDPLVKTLYQRFGANPVRLPESRVKPLCVVAAKGKKVVFAGRLAPLIDGGLEVPPDIFATSRMADPAGHRSGEVDVGLGLDILGKFLEAFGIPAPGVTAQFAGATTVAFSFQNVVRDWIDVPTLGKLLASRSVDRTNQNAKIYVSKPRWQMLVIDSVIQSTDFTVAAAQTMDVGFKVDAPAIQKLFADADVKASVSSSSEKALTFTGTEPLTFAFTAVEFHLDDYGNISSMPPSTKLTPLSFGEESAARTQLPDRIEFSKEPVMIDWDK